MKQRLRFCFLEKPADNRQILYIFALMNPGCRTARPGTGRKVNRTFIQVILPLRLEWEPYYALPEGTHVSLGARVQVLFSGKTYTAVVCRTDATPDIPPDKIKEILAVEQDIRPVTAEEIRFWRFISDYYLCTMGEVYQAAYPTGRIAGEKTSALIRQRLQQREEKEQARRAARRELLEKRIQAREAHLDKARKESVRETLRADIVRMKAQLVALQETSAPVEDRTSEGASICLTPAQEKALKQIQEAFAQGKNALLKGVTGSGKTELYLTLAKAALQKGRNVLYLTPEIAMGYQLAERIRRIFPAEFLSYTSAESPVVRRETADRVAGGPYFVLGTRSALFLPHHDLGLVIVDEEHDTSYKQDSPAPRYQGRDCALVLAAQHDCPVILGSATPSLESLYNCKTGKFVLVSLAEKYYGSGAEDIEIIDTQAERRKNGMEGHFSLKLILRIRETLRQGRQVMILRARRAYSPAVQCENCGQILRCPDCHVALSYHQDKGRLICHYCGHTEPFTNQCPHCGGPLALLGAGTQKIEEEAANLFPQARVARLDSDTPPAQAARIIDAFAAGETDILIGTQMLAKGFDFRQVALTVILQADSLLGLDDFRADEKAVQLLSQLRGRSGRRGGDSCFIIQTSQPEHPVYQMLSGAGPDLQMAERKDFSYPPFTRLVGLILKDENEARLETVSRKLAAALHTSLPDILLSGPYAPAVDRVAGKFIRHIRLTLPRDASLKTRKERLLRTVTDFCRDNRYDGHVSIDVDPA